MRHCHHQQPARHPGTQPDPHTRCTTPEQVDLTARIRAILRDYPEGGSIFKELTQNADDAGAKEVGGLGVLAGSGS